MASTDSGIGKKFDHSQSPTYSLYSGDETVLAKQQDVQTTPMEGYPVTYSTSGTPAVPYSLDAALTTPSIVNTLSGDASTLLFGSVRRICPPGVDYGHQYPVSYLRLAEQGYTAVTSSDLLSSISPLSATTTPAFIRRPPPSASASSTQRLSRRDMPSTHHSQTRTLPTSSADSTSRQGGGFMDHRYCAQVFGEVDGARPEKDRYTRYRQLSPAGSLMGRALSSGRSVGAPPNFIVRKSQTYSSYSTPNVNSRRGIRVLAESMMRSPPRVGRSVSPEAAVLAQAEARRLAAYPGAKIPDADSEPAIDRYDWPAPPSPAVVMIDRRREKAMKSGTLPDGRTITKSEESSSDTRTLSPGTVHSLSPEKDAPPTSVESKINTLKRTTGNSGMSAAVAQYVEEEEKRQKTSSFDLDPISASRSPSANFEPPYSTRYANHRFASPSRSTLRREMRDGLTGTRDHFSTSPIIPRPGYTSGILSSRPVSLPRGVNGVTSTTFPPWSSAVSPAQRKIYASNTSRTLPANTTSGPLSDSRNGAFTLTTSGLSMNGMAGATEAQLAQPLTTLATNRDSRRARSTTLTGGLPPPSISGLRPVGPRSYNYLGGTSFELSRGRQTKAAAINTTNGWRTARTASENARFSARGGSNALLDDEYPDVQSWLRPTKSQQYQGQKIYSYDQLKVSSNANLKGIDERHREEYLSAEEFERLFKMPKTAFQRLPEWKKSDLKRRLDLY
uniref:Villin headpiece n=1 Tax=Echinococcus granulosus TaxID=6210 RepID=A0A068WUE8_ECHGR|nr:Villin headpiece [Echinococcus granulosus]